MTPLTDHESTRRPTHRSRESRFFRHVMISETTRRTLKTVKRVKRGALAMAGLLAVTALVLSYSSGSGLALPISTARAVNSVGGVGSAISRRGLWGAAAACGGACALVLSAAAQKFEGCFYQNFERHPVLE